MNACGDLQIEKMSSRRLMNRSLSSDGRSYYSASDITSQNRMSGSRSYLSSVRSESRYRFMIPDVKSVPLCKAFNSGYYGGTVPVIC